MGRIPGSGRSDAAARAAPSGFRRADGAATPAAASPASLTATVLELAAAQGFDAAAVAPVEAIPAALRLEEWLSGGMHGSMQWMARNPARRSDPRLVLEGARSVLVVAMSYYTGDDPAPRPESGCISRYAWGNEYHRLLGERLEALWGAIAAAVPEARGRWYVDTGPVLEKAWAERAGMGWIGKHTNLISQRLGSWIFLGALITDLDLQPGNPHPDRCGTCRACIDICPTAAIVAPYVLDARRCIAYLTIENRGPIPRSMRPGIGNRIFGCDDCQEVCPWNRFARASSRAADFAPREENRAPALVELLQLDEAAFRQRFAGSPVLRARRSGFVRNVAVALGNSGDPAAVAPLAGALRDPDALVRGHAAWALGEIGGAAAAGALRRRRPEEPDDGVVEEIDAAMQMIASG